MTNFIVNNGDNYGTFNNDNFFVEYELYDFFIDAGDGYDTFYADVNIIKDVISGEMQSVEEFVFSGSSDSTFIAQFGGDKIIDLSQVSSLAYVFVTYGQDLFISGGRQTVVVFHPDLESSAYQSTMSFQTGNATLYRNFDENVTVNSNNIYGYFAPEVTLNNITGNDDNNVVLVKRGTHNFTGSGGIDTVVIVNNQINAQISDYEFTIGINDSMAIQGTGAASEVRINTNSVERISFIGNENTVSETIAFDVGVGENAGEAYRIYKAAFDRTPDNDGLEFWIDKIDTGTSLIDVAKGFIASAEFKSVYGIAPTNLYFVDELYQNVLGRAGESSGVAYWVDELNSGHRDFAQVLADFSESPENVANIAPLIDHGILLT